jgi:hypothetical protein
MFLLVQDFVELQKWEDRGYYAMRERTEGAQRKLHKMQRKASAVLSEPAAAVLAGAAKSIGMADLAAPDSLSLQHPQKQQRHKAAAQLDAQVSAAEVCSLVLPFPCSVCLASLIGFIEFLADHVTLLLSLQVGVDAAHWQTFCSTVIRVVADHHAASNPSDAEHTRLYHQRIPQIAQRLQGVLASAISEEKFATGVHVP